MTEPVHILHVDDEPGFADMAATFLQRADDRFTVEIATSVSEGMERLTEDNFDCVISDYDMPGQNGIEFLETIRENNPDLPFILFTGKGSEEVASDALSAGATDYLQKGPGTDQYDLLANRIQNAIEQYRTRQRAVELNRIRTLASDINQALVRAESRREIDSQVCEIISNSDPYLFAWIGNADSDTDRIEPRQSAGISDGYLDEITVTADDSPTGQGPGGTAIRERQIAVSQDVTDDPEFEPWREEALDRGYRAVAAVPLEYENTLYGELVVYADRPNAFDEDEQELLVELGDDIAHAHHSLVVRDRLRKERDRRQALFENAPGPVIAAEIGQKGDTVVMTDTNDAFEKVFGYDTEEVAGKDPADLIIPEEGLDRHEEFREQVATGESVITEVERRTTEGLRTFLLHIIPFTEGSDRVSGLYAWFTDISDRLARERAIEELHNTTHTLMETESSEEVAEITVAAVRDILGMPANGVHLYDESGGGLVPVAWTAETEAVVGEPPTFAPGEGIAGTAFETGEPHIYDDISSVSERFNPDTDVRSQIVLPLDDHGVLVIGSPDPDAFDDTDVSLAQTLVSHATTAISRIKQERKREEIIDRVTDAIVEVDADWQFTLVNEHAEDLYDMDEEELLGQNFWDVFAEAQGTRFEEEYREVMNTRESTSFTEYYGELDGWFDIDVYPKNDGGLAFYFREVTGRIERSRELERRSDRFQYVEEVADIGYWEIDPQTPEPYDVTLSDGIYHIHDLTPDEPFDVEKGLQFYHPEDRPTVEQAVERAISDGEPYDHEVRLITDSGRERWVHSVGEPVERDGEVVMVRGVFQDVTDRKQQEQELQRQNERLEEFASIVSHDLRNPLNVAQGRLELAMEECDSEHLDSIDVALKRSQTLIDDLLTLAREGDEVNDIETVDFGSLADSCWHNVATGEATITIETDRSIRADRSRLQQLLENLYRNAIDHGGEDVTVTVGDLPDGFYIEDDGPGIPADERDDVFDVGYSTTQDGTGFGLSIVQQVAEAHGWTVEIVEGKTGGARFEITGVGSPSTDQ